MPGRRDWIGLESHGEELTLVKMTAGRRLEPRTPLSRATAKSEELSRVPFPRVVERFEQGALTLTWNDEPVLVPLQARPLLAEVLEQQLPKLAQAALLPA